MNAEQISSWLTDYISKVAQIPLQETLPDREFTSFGIDSSAAVGLSVDLGDWAGIEIDPTLVYDYPTIELISEFVANKLNSVKPATQSAVAV